MSSERRTADREPMCKRPIWNSIYKLIRGKYPPDGYAYNSLAYNALKPLRKWVTVSLAPSCPSNSVRIALYRACGFKIGKNVFIGMRCYLDDMCHDLLTIGDNVTISYGVYFACHGRHQGHYPIEVQDGAYIGMRASVISKNKSGRGGGRHWPQRGCGGLRPRQLRRAGWRDSGRRALRDYAETRLDEQVW